MCSTARVGKVMFAMAVACIIPGWAFAAELVLNQTGESPSLKRDDPVPRSEIDREKSVGPRGAALSGVFEDYLATYPPTWVTFGSPFVPPIRADFFDPGSDPFFGLVQLGGQPINPPTLGPTSTIIRRPGPPFLPADPPGGPVNVPIEIVALSLVSVNPITVTYFGGFNPEQWNVSVRLSPTVMPQPPGNIRALKTHANGGTFDSVIQVVPLFTFVRQTDMAVRQLDAGMVPGLPPIRLESFGDPWVHSVNPALQVITQPGCAFVPGVVEVVPGDPSSQLVQMFDERTQDGGQSVTHSVCPAQRRVCIYDVDCMNSLFKGACNDCGLDCGDVCASVINCEGLGSCPTYTAPCPGLECCINLHPLACDVPAPTLPACPDPGNPCPCAPMSGACCDPQTGICSIVSDECDCTGRFIPGVTTCGPFGACCFGDYTCREMHKACCENLGGTFEGGTCDPPRECCFPDDTCQMVDPECCSELGGKPGPGDCDGPRECCLLGGACIFVDDHCCRVNHMGSPGPPGSVCDTPVECCLGNGVCVNVDPDCCTRMLMGTPHAPFVCDNPLYECCFADGTCGQLDRLCCVDQGGTPNLQDDCDPIEACCNINGGPCTQAEPHCCSSALFNGFANGVRMCQPVQRCCGGIFGNPPAQQDCVNDDPVCCNTRFGVPAGGLCVQAQACCLQDLSCQDVDPVCCGVYGGVPLGPGTACGIEREACCLGDGTCLYADPVCCAFALGGTPQGIATVCSAQHEPCCLPDGTCEVHDPICCDDLGGTVVAGGTCGGALQGCCFADGSCDDLDPLCCVDQGGTPQGAGSACLGDINPMNGRDDLCESQVGCVPDPLGTACVPVGCLMPGHECRPKKVQCLPPGPPNCVITECECIFPTACHVELPPGGVPNCTGGCAPNETCDMQVMSGPGGSMMHMCMCTGPQACCLNNGNMCAELLAAECLLAGGVPQGPGTSCTAPQACCLPNGSCVFVDPLCCDEAGGVPRGPGSFCKPYADISPKPGDGVVELGDVLKILDAYSDLAPCINYPNAELVYDGGCPKICTTVADCTGALPPICTSLGECCDGVDIGEVLAILDAYAGIVNCPDGACP